ncbi:resolvase [Methylobacterium sp. NMS14P]|uniref:resolvase n=1 Tax=Methylobacterium sp. NMS14P TaxID=2894310 RepID=UPI002358406D|nr:resolvase [Methylobacterium sp. NMS14P]WCS25231.1 resolvase [Methylobacterium sp. NMS14P]
MTEAALALLAQSRAELPKVNIRRRKPRGDPAKGVAELKAVADKRAAALAPVVTELKAEGHSSVRKLADAMNARGVPTERGGPWHVTGVQRLLKRIKTL